MKKNINTLVNEFVYFHTALRFMPLEQRKDINRTIFSPIFPTFIALIIVLVSVIKYKFYWIVFLPHFLFTELLILLHVYLTSYLVFKYLGEKRRFKYNRFIYIFSYSLCYFPVVSAVCTFDFRIGAILMIILSGCLSPYLYFSVKKNAIYEIEDYCFIFIIGAIAYNIIFIGLTCLFAYDFILLVFNFFRT
ncbi:hypothetical protein GVAV_002311 [Gurleya vavrai]